MSLIRRKASFSIPGWACPNHPIMRREAAALPSFIVRTEDLRRRPASLLGLAVFWLMPLACGFSSLPWQVIVAPLGWLPLIWAGPVISREVRARTWDALCSTPYSPAEVLLAKLAAVIYRLLPPLIVLLVSQVMFYGAILGDWIFEHDTRTIYIAFDGHAIQRNDLIGGPLPLEKAVIIGLLFLLLGLACTLLAFAANATLGALAAALFPETGPAWALIARAALDIAWLFLLPPILRAATGDSITLWRLIGFIAYMGAPGWAIPALLPGHGGAALLAGLLTLLVQAALLGGVLALAIRRVRRLSGRVGSV